MQSIETNVLKRIYGRGRGSVHIPGDFLDLGSRRAIDIALHRAAKRGVLQRLARGLYYFPNSHLLLGELQPSPEVIAKALAGRDKIRLQPTGAYAANLLGLSEQVPAKVVFLTEGATRTVRTGAQTIQLRHTTPRNTAAANRLSGLVIQALRYLGQRQIQPHHLDHLRQTIPAAERKALLQDLRLAPIWMQAMLRELADAD